MQLSEIQEIEYGDVPAYFPELAKDGHRLIEHMTLGLVGEAGEIANDVKKWHRGDFDVIELQQRLRKELPDVLIYLVLLSEALAFDLQEAYDEKKAFNEQRYRT